MPNRITVQLPELPDNYDHSAIASTQTEHDGSSALPRTLAYVMLPHGAGDVELSVGGHDKLNALAWLEDALLHAVADIHAARADILSEQQAEADHIREQLLELDRDYGNFTGSSRGDRELADARAIHNRLSSRLAQLEVAA